MEDTSVARMVLLLLCVLQRTTKGERVMHCYGEFITKVQCPVQQIIVIGDAYYGVSKCNSMPNQCCPATDDCVISVSQQKPEYFAQIQQACNGQRECVNLRADWTQGTDCGVQTSDYVTIEFVCVSESSASPHGSTTVNPVSNPEALTEKIPTEAAPGIGAHTGVIAGACVGLLMMLAATTIVVFLAVKSRNACRNAKGCSPMMGQDNGGLDGPYYQSANANNSAPPTGKPTPPRYVPGHTASISKLQKLNKLKNSNLDNDEKSLKSGIYITEHWSRSKENALRVNGILTDDMLGKDLLNKEKINDNNLGSDDEPHYATIDESRMQLPLQQILREAALAKQAESNVYYSSIPDPMPRTQQDHRNVPVENNIYYSPVEDNTHSLRSAPRITVDDGQDIYYSAVPEEEEKPNNNNQSKRLSIAGKRECMAHSGEVTCNHDTVHLGSKDRHDSTSSGCPEHNEQVVSTLAASGEVYYSAVAENLSEGTCSVGSFPTSTTELVDNDMYHYAEDTSTVESFNYATKC